MQTETHRVTNGDTIEPTIGPGQTLEIIVDAGVTVAIVPETTVQIHQHGEHSVVMPGQALRVSGDFRVEHSASCHSRLLIRSLAPHEFNQPQAADAT